MSEVFATGWLTNSYNMIPDLRKILICLPDQENTSESVADKLVKTENTWQELSKNTILIHFGQVFQKLC